MYLNVVKKRFLIFFYLSYFSDSYLYDASTTRAWNKDYALSEQCKLYFTADIGKTVHETMVDKTLTP